MLARLQQRITLALFLAVLIAWSLFGSRNPWLALAISLAAPLAYIAVLGLECLLAAHVNRLARHRSPSIFTWTRAWWRESLAGPGLFCWRQPFRSQAEPDFLSDQGAEGQRGVIFVHGFFCNRAFWAPWMSALRQRGHTFVSVNLEPVFESIDAYEEVIGEAVKKVRQSTGLSPILVCHSMGGLAARRWLANQPDASCVHRVVTIATPHRGTWLARFGHGTSARQMRPGSPWLMALETQSAPALNALFVCWFSRTDNIVFPADNACLPGADNKELTGLAHVGLAFSPDVMAHTFAMLSSAEPKSSP